MSQFKLNLDSLLESHRSRPGIVTTKRLHFLGLSGAVDVYNISRAFTWRGQEYIAGRVEPRDSELSSVRFFKRVGIDLYEALPLTLNNLQDPCVAFIDGFLLVGGTEIYPDESGRITSWRTVYYKGQSLDDLQPVIYAPMQMKDVRLAQCGRYYVMSRPQGGNAKWGKIGFTTSPDLSGITAELIEKAPLIEDLFDDDHWGGANQIHCLKNGWLGILGHVARMSEGYVRHYYGMTFALNPKTLEHTPVKIICERADFAPGAAKRPDLTDVVFVGGLVRHKNKTATLYTGLSDAEAHYAVIEDPFLEYEELPSK
ncbi:MAG: DUF1861 family protein [Bacilli bacterium]|jgi:hypothetical protein